MPEKLSQIPFEELRPTSRSGFFTELKEIPHKPGTVVKEVKATQESNFEDYLKEAEVMKSYIQQCREGGLSEFIPQTDFVIGKNEKGFTTLYIVQEFIEEQPFVSEDLAKRNKFLINLVKGLLEIYFNTYDGKQGKIIEIEKEANFIWGNKINDKENKRVHAIDLLPVHTRPPFGLRAVLEKFCDNYQIDKGNFDIELDKLNSLEAKMGT